MSWFGEWLGGGGGGGGGSGPPGSFLGGPFSAGDIIRQARVRNPAFSEQAIPFPVALSMVSTVQADLHQAAQQRDPFYVVGTYLHLLTTFVALVPLPSHAGVSGGLVTLRDPDGGMGELYVATRTARLRAPRKWTAVLINEKLTLVGDADYWRDVKQVEVYYAPVATALANETSILLLPSSAWSAVIASLAAQMGARCQALGISGIDLKDLNGQAATSIRVWLDTVAGVGKAMPVRVGGRR